MRDSTDILIITALDNMRQKSLQTASLSIDGGTCSLNILICERCWQKFERQSYVIRLTIELKLHCPHAVTSVIWMVSTLKHYIQLFLSGFCLLNKLQTSDQRKFFFQRGDIEVHHVSVIRVNLV